MTHATKRSLWLIRHAEAEDPALGQHDSERRLSDRGMRDIDRLVEHWAQQPVRPVPWIWVSPARRTQQTAQPLASLWQSQLITEPTLYLGDAHELLDCLQGTPADLTQVALVGHNPGITWLAQFLLADNASKTLPTHLPTLGAVQLSYTGDWPDLAEGVCSLEVFLTPGVVAADG